MHDWPLNSVHVSRGESMTIWSGFIFYFFSYRLVHHATKTSRAGRWVEEGVGWGRRLGGGERKRLGRLGTNIFPCCKPLFYIVQHTYPLQMFLGKTLEGMHPPSPCTPIYVTACMVAIRMYRLFNTRLHYGWSIHGRHRLMQNNWCCVAQHRYKSMNTLAKYLTWSTFSSNVSPQSKLHLTVNNTCSLQPIDCTKDSLCLSLI